MNATTTWADDLRAARTLKGDDALAALRRLYRAVAAGTAPTGWEGDIGLSRAAERAGERCFAAFAAKGLVRFVLCTHCKGDGISRGTDRGMGCGYCHGRSYITEEFAGFLAGHRSRIESRYGHGASRA